MASQEKNQQSQGPAGPDKKTEDPGSGSGAEPAPLEFSPTGLYIKDRKGKERPLMHSVQAIVDVYNGGGCMSIYGIQYPTIQALPSHIRGAINEVSGPGAAVNSPDEIRARIKALEGELKERSATMPA